MKQLINIPKPEKGKRDPAIDNLKSVLIILVILGHSGLLTAFKSPFGNFLQSFIYLFHMPLFFCISGLFIKKFSWQYFIRRFLQLMLPFYFFVIVDPVNIIYQLIHPGISAIPLLFDLHIKEVIKKVFVGSAFYLQNALWFLPSLFLSNILFSILYKHRHNKWVIIMCCLVFFSVLFFSNTIQKKHYCIPYGIDIVIYIVPAMFLIRTIYAKKQHLIIYHPLIYILGIIISSFLIFYIIPKNPSTILTGRLDLAQFYVPNTIWGYMLICILSVFIFLLFLNFTKKTIFSEIGYYSMPIFILHFYPWFNGLQHLGPFAFLCTELIGSITIGIVVSKSLMKLSSKFSWIGMIA